MLRTKVVVTHRFKAVGGRWWGCWGRFAALGFLGIKLLEALLGVWLDFNVCRCFLEFLAAVQLTFDL